MRRRKNRHIGSKHAPVPNRHKTAVQNRKIEIRIKPLAQRNVTAVVNVKGGFNEDVVVADVADYGFEHCESRGGEDVEASRGGRGGRREPGVEVVCEGAGAEFCSIESWIVRVVAWFGVSFGADFIESIWMNRVDVMLAVLTASPRSSSRTPHTTARG
jgi:hypothetical protein